MGLKINGATDGSIELDVPASCGSDLSVTLPATAGEVVVANTSGDVDLGGLTVSGSAADDSVNIDSSGRLLVGTTSSREQQGVETSFQVENTEYDGLSLVVNGGTVDSQSPSILMARSRGTANGSSTLVSSGDRLGAIYFQGADGTDIQTAAAGIECRVDGVASSNDMPGRLTFHTTADGASSSTERMRIDNAGQTNHFSSGNAFISATSQNAGTTYWLYRGIRSRTTNTSGGATVFYVYSNGNVQNTNNSYGAISDVKLKENIVDATSQWDDLKAIQVRKYNFIEGETHTQLGVIAQEVETVSPGLVYETIDRDEEDNDLGTVTKNVNYSVLYMKAVKALQEAQARIETLETQHADLLARVAALEAA